MANRNRRSRPLLAARRGAAPYWSRGKGTLSLLGVVGWASTRATRRGTGGLTFLRVGGYEVQGTGVRGPCPLSLPPAFSVPALLVVLPDGAPAVSVEMVDAERTLEGLRMGPRPTQSPQLSSLGPACLCAFSFSPFGWESWRSTRAREVPSIGSGSQRAHRRRWAFRV